MREGPCDRCAHAGGAQTRVSGPRPLHTCNRQETAAGAMVYNRPTEPPACTLHFAHKTGICTTAKETQRQSMSIFTHMTCMDRFQDLGEGIRSLGATKPHEQLSLYKSMRTPRESCDRGFAVSTHSPYIRSSGLTGQQPCILLL